MSVPAGTDIGSLVARVLTGSAAANCVTHESRSRPGVPKKSCILLDAKTPTASVEHDFLGWASRCQCPGELPAVAHRQVRERQLWRPEECAAIHPHRAQPRRARGR